MDSSVAEQVKWALDYLLVTYDETKLKDKRTNLRTSLYDYIWDNGEEDEDGNVLFYFDKPMTVDGEEWFTGLKLQRRVNQFINEEQAWRIVREHNLQNRCIKTVEVLDYDELYAANQEGLVTDEEMDAILEQDESWALVKMK